MGFTSEAERMKILEVVFGSNQRLIQLQTVGKKEGAPIICVVLLVSLTRRIGYCFSGGMYMFLRKFDPTSRDNELLPTHSHPAYGSSGSRIASTQRR